MNQVKVLKQTTEFLQKPKKNFINGVWQNALSEQTFSVENPANGDFLAEVAHSKKEDVNLAVKSARQAFMQGPWANMPPNERAKLLWRLGDLIEQNTEELAQLESLDNGKPLQVAKAADVPLAADMFRYMSGWATKIFGETFPVSVPYTPGVDYLTYTLKEPIGVVGQIIPWNFPLLMAAWKLAPALTTGCTVVLKPAEQTPLTAIRLGELIQEAGFPAGVVNIVTGFGDAGAALAEHLDVDKVAFTGSTEVGKQILQAARGNLKKVSLELGGKSPNIIFKDADLKLAIPGAASSIFFNHGQCCCAGSRLFVEQSIYDQVVEGVSKIANGIKVGEGFAPDTEMGPLVSKEQLDRVCGYIDSGKSAGAQISAGGERLNNKGYFIRPTVFTKATPSMDIVKEEIFGPVVAILPFKDQEDLIKAANDSQYGLAAGIWTNNIQKAHQTSAALKAGTTWINCYNIFDAALPFGGYKESGWGREMGRDALNLYTQTKAVCAKI